MALIPLKPLFLKDSTLKIDEDNFENAVSGVTFTPTTSAATWTGLTPKSTFSEQTSPTWVAQLDYVQDWESTESLSRYLHDHAGESKSVTFAPKAGGTEVTATLVIVPGPIGGAGGAFATASVTCGSDYPVIGSGSGTSGVASETAVASDTTTVA